MNQLRWFGFVVLLQGVLLGCSGGSSGPSSELRLASFAETAQVDAEFDREHSFSFVVVGCNRINAADVTPDNPSTANREQLNRTFREVAALRPLPRFMFFAGDLVLGYTDDPNLVERELSAWRDIYEASPLADTDVRLVAIPGNHEVQGASSPRRAYRAAEEVWLRKPRLGIASRSPGTNSRPASHASVGSWAKLHSVASSVARIRVCAESPSSRFLCVIERS